VSDCSVCQARFRLGVHCAKGVKYSPQELRTTHAWRVIEDGVELGDAAFEGVDGAAVTEQGGDASGRDATGGQVVEHKLEITGNKLQKINSGSDSPAVVRVKGHLATPPLASTANLSMNW
jgi:hypothetical protein